MASSKSKGKPDFFMDYYVRRATNRDVPAMEKLMAKRNINMFSENDISYSKEMSVLTVCLFDTSDRLIGFISLFDYPDVPSVDSGEWEAWIRAAYGVSELIAHNTLFIHLLCCLEDMCSIFIRRVLYSVFMHNAYLRYVAFTIPWNTFEVLLPNDDNLKNLFLELSPSGIKTPTANTKLLYSIKRIDICDKLQVRKAVPEDNDDLADILRKQCKQLQEMYGKFYISELVTVDPNATRTLLVAEHNELAVGLMSFNSVVNYKFMQANYYTEPFVGFTKLPKEQVGNMNSLRGLNVDKCKQQSFFVAYGTGDGTSTEELVERGIFNKYKSETSIASAVSLRQQKPTKHIAFELSENDISQATERGNEMYCYDFIKQEESWSNIRLGDLTTQIRMENEKRWIDENEAFDFEIVNIDSKLFTVPELLDKSFGDLFTNKVESDFETYKSPQTTKKTDNADRIPTNTTESWVLNFVGEPNAFILEIFAVDEHYDERCAFDLLEAAFEVFHDLDYCLLSIPCGLMTFPLLENFTFVTPKGECKHALYCAHRNSILGKLRVRKAEVFDVSEVTRLIRTIDDPADYIDNFEESVLDPANTKIPCVMLSDGQIVGVSVLSLSDETSFINANYKMESTFTLKHHRRRRGADSAYVAIQVLLLAPTHQPHSKFFLREMMRQSGYSMLYWFYSYKKRISTLKLITALGEMTPIQPRKSQDHIRGKFRADANGTYPSALWFISRKLTSWPKIEVNSRLVVVGGSRTAIAFLETLIFKSSALTFTSVTLVSNHGIPVMRHCPSAASRLLLCRYRADDNYLKKLPFPHYVYIVRDVMTEINRKDQYIVTSGGRHIHYDYLFILCGTQYQHPDYLKEPHALERNHRNPNTYVRLDDPTKKEIDYKKTLNYPLNVFIVNDTYDAHKSISTVKYMYKREENCTVIVYGATIHAFCCISGLLDIGIPPSNIIFVEPFPPEDDDSTPCIFNNLIVETAVDEEIKKMGIQVYQRHYFVSWDLNEQNFITSVRFISHERRVDVECEALFYYGTKGVDINSFCAFNESGLVYDGGLVVDKEYRTNDKHIYAAGSITKYKRIFHSNIKDQGHFNTHEIGKKLGLIIKDKLNPLRLKAQKRNSTSDKFDDSKESASPKSTRIFPTFTRPLYVMCVLPGNLNYMEVSSPGLIVPVEVSLQTVDDKILVMETNKNGYFRLLVGPDNLIKSITCLSKNKIYGSNLACLWGHHIKILNHLDIKYKASLVDDLFDYFDSFWIQAIYDDCFDILLKEIYEYYIQISYSALLKENSSKSKVRLTLVQDELRTQSLYEENEACASIVSMLMGWLGDRWSVMSSFLAEDHYIPRSLHLLTANSAIDHAGSTI